MAFIAPFVLARGRAFTYRPLARVRVGVPTQTAVWTCTMSKASTSASGTLAFLRVVGQLKRTKRAGWTRFDVPQVESVGDHMYRMGIIAMLVSDKAVACKATKMALVHDLAEAIVGDITPHDGVSPEDKSARESRAITEIVSTIDKDIADEIVELWKEYEQGTSDVARLLKDIDKFEMILQADEYERLHQVDLQEFFDSTSKYFKTEQVLELANELRRQRNERRAVKETK